MTPEMVPWLIFCTGFSATVLVAGGVAVVNIYLQWRLWTAIEERPCEEIAIEPTDEDWDRVADQTIRNLIDKGHLPPPEMMEDSFARDLQEALTSDPRFRFYKDADGRLMVGLAEEEQA